jgi:hypothetical protein
METRIAFASLPQWRWSVPFQFLRVADPFEYQTLASFYNDRKGQLGFLPVLRPGRQQRHRHELRHG